jgi:ubiquinone/menaquinone biosynthesis C-methylase UbiE
MHLLQTFLCHYARQEARALSPHVRGPRLLDLGAGEGWVGEALRERCGGGEQRVRWVCDADVGPFLLTARPYVVYDGTRLPFRDDAFDTTLLSLTLHHCEKPEVVLDEAVRVTRSRLLVVESVYKTRLQRFWLDLLDARLNRHRHGGAMHAPLAFRRPEEWQALFESRRLQIVAREWLGTWLERRIHHPLLFVMSPGRSSGPSRS